MTGRERGGWPPHDDLEDGAFPADPAGDTAARWWRAAVRAHFVHPRPGPGRGLLGLLGLAAAGPACLAAAVVVTAYWRARLGLVDRLTAREFYDIAAFAPLAAGLAVIVLAPLAAGRVLRPWVLLPPALLLTAGAVGLLLPLPLGF